MLPEPRTLQFEQRQHSGRTPVQDLGSFLHATGLHTSNQDEESLSALRGLVLLLGRAAGLWPFHLQRQCVPLKDFCGLPREDHPRCNDRLSLTQVSFPVGGLSLHYSGFQ